MSTMRLRGLLAVAVFAFMAAGATAQVHLGTVSFSAGYSRFSGPYFPYYDPFWWDRYGYPFGPVYFAPVVSRPMGQVSIETPEKKAEVYIEDGYAGTAEKLKKIWLDPGVYKFELRAPGKTPEQQRVYVLSNKTVKLSFGKAKR